MYFPPGKEIASNITETYVADGRFVRSKSIQDKPSTHSLFRARAERRISWLVVCGCYSRFSSPSALFTKSTARTSPQDRADSLIQPTRRRPARRSTFQPEEIFRTR